MKLQSLREKELLRAIRKDFSASFQDLSVGIGDDAAAIRVGRGYLVLTKDMLIEDFHFITELHPPFLLGRKSLSVNLSDIAAMGGTPKYVLLGLGLPAHVKPGWVEEYFSGFKSAVEESKSVLAGGDVSQSKNITVSVTIIGESKKIIRRSGGKPGHLLYTSGNLGDARQGFFLLKRGFKLGDDKKADPLLKSFLDPVPQLSLAKELSRLSLASSLIDISDGLSVDLLNLCQESRCGAEIEQERLPLSPELCYWQRRPYNLALHGGEDYQLLFSVPSENKEALVRLEKKHRITCIGKMIRNKCVYLIDKQGKRKPLEAKGYQHFKAY